ncbi:hypothetical protein COW36_18890 [bacterium (Candidatus Blackallbacteria) CG17_big_fil_post_rev_8_21_14_2_50_48_46]|uniref:Uncharacterized protein n=1 Tax=bacterium (Candidatus Blackallbacteria) CG17_big_fil_post_rev_8_21_14_2_50_48_46 TaxID=2014261 RepID=A0A2M7G085_9BACT|nr:MAG: hypothetical protein COW64_25580 [bacterium (Candidatus Blackallbacteria) CG18_big_fil_WC_8_21_14_2_50_49_26]PIW14994.1 MAG: hypothetical protein COW36_18890 [bacterium (Candidatus Blackallbacteria) CG17_big_fil_post_rev_8_21_14_2_50_48_46]PIW50075.1 MAG: hypothetical protein COW20_03825 [bacterium (Candidatus Blackallbacteria) CG13_big_fil_rev_8_21_14_2_50_49_14]
MDLKELLNTHEKVAQSRRKVGTQYCDQGYQFLREAEATGFQNKELLKQASNSFIQAIRQERANAEAYIGLGYLLLLLSDFKAAETQFKTALRLAPQNQDAKKLLDFTFQKLLGKPKSKSVPSHEGEQLFYQLAEEIRTAVKNLHAQPILLPTHLQAGIEALHHHQRKLQSMLAEFESEIKHLDLDFPTDSLLNLLQPLRESLRLHQKLIQTSEDMRKLFEGLENLQTQIASALSAKQNLTSAEKIHQFEHTHLEMYLDECDRLADHLDALSENGHDTQELEKIYLQIVHQLEFLQEYLDEQLEKFKA